MLICIKNMYIIWLIKWMEVSLENGCNKRLQLNVTYFFNIGKSYYDYVILFSKSEKRNLKKETHTRIQPS